MSHINNSSIMKLIAWFKYSYAVVLYLSLLACSAAEVKNDDSAEACPIPMLASIEGRVSALDSEGHGPDLGSDEWFSAIEFRLGLRGQSALPEKGTNEWCDFLDRHLENIVIRRD